MDFKAGYYRSNEVISLKASSGGFGENPQAFGLPTGMGTILLFDARTCALVCVMDGSLITGLRTGAAGAVSVKALARKDARRITSIGNGNQARMQIRAIAEVQPIEAVHAWDENPEASAQFKADLEGESRIPVRVAGSKREAVEQADILITTTRGKGSLVEAGWVKPGTHIIAIGTDQLGKQELDPEVFRHAKIVNDSIEQCVQKGETWNPLDGTSSPGTTSPARSARSCWGRSPGGRTTERSRSSTPPGWPSRTTPPRTGSTGTPCSAGWEPLSSSSSSCAAAIRRSRPVPPGPGGQRQPGGGQVFAEVGHGRGAGDQQDVGRPVQQPGQGDLHGRGPEPPRDGRQGRRLQGREPAEREERDVGDSLPGQFVDQRVVLALGQVVEVLHGPDGVIARASATCAAVTLLRPTWRISPWRRRSARTVTCSAMDPSAGPWPEPNTR